MFNPRPEICGGGGQGYRENRAGGYKPYTPFDYKNMLEKGNETKQNERKKNNFIFCLIIIMFKQAINCREIKSLLKLSMDAAQE